MNYFRLKHKSDCRLAVQITSEIINKLPHVTSILDIGCGDGVVRLHLNKGISYQGIDISNACIYEQVKNDPEISYVDPNILVKSIQDAPYHDCLLLLDVIEHTKEFTELVLVSAKKEPNYIVISLPNELIIFDWIRFLFGKELPAHSLDLIGLPYGFKHQYIVNIDKARNILVQELQNYGFNLNSEFYRELKPKKFWFQPVMWIISRLFPSSIWSMGSIFIFEKDQN